MTRPRHYQLASFPPEFIELFTRVGVSGEPIIIKLPSFGRAVRFRQLMYTLRLAMRQSGHPAVEVADRCEISIGNPEYGDAPYAEVRLRANSFVDAVREAGVTIASTPPASPSPPLSPLLVEQTIANFLSQEEKSE